MIRLGPGIYTSRFFYVEGPRCNVFGALQREDDQWSVTWRFRHYVDVKVHDSEDTRSWYQIEIVDESKGLQAITDLVRVLCMARGLFGVDRDAPVDMVVVDSDDPDVAFTALNRTKWAHVRVEMDMAQETP